MTFCRPHEYTAVKELASWIYAYGTSEGVERSWLKRQRARSKSKEYPDPTGDKVSRMEFQSPRSSSYWIKSDGTIIDAHGGHYKSIQNIMGKLHTEFDLGKRMDHYGRTKQIVRIFGSDKSMGITTYAPLTDRQTALLHSLKMRYPQAYVTWEHHNADGSKQVGTEWDGLLQRRAA